MSQICKHFVLYVIGRRLKMTCLPSEFLSFSQNLPIFADFSRFFSRGKSVDDNPLVPGGFEGANFEKLFPRCGSTFSTQKKIYQENFFEFKKISKIWVSPPLAFCFFGIFLVNI